MIYPEVRNIHSIDLVPPQLPEDPFDCEVFFKVIVGPTGGEGEEPFRFSVITPARLARTTEPVWGRGVLIMPAFEWAAVVQALAKLLSSAARPSWGEVVAELSRELTWDVELQEEADA